MIRIYFTDDGKAVIRFPSGLIPDAATCARGAQILNAAATRRAEAGMPENENGGGCCRSLHQTQ